MKKWDYRRLVHSLDRNCAIAIVEHTVTTVVGRNVIFVQMKVLILSINVDILMSSAFIIDFENKCGSQKQIHSL